MCVQHWMSHRIHRGDWSVYMTAICTAVYIFWPHDTGKRPQNITKAESLQRFREIQQGFSNLLLLIEILIPLIDKSLKL